jgi:transcriptional regulator with XRE-family HTH domain
LSIAKIAGPGQQVAELFLTGWTQQDIATKLGLAQSTVSNDLKAIQEEWRDSGVLDFDLARAVEVQKLLRLERELWDAYRRYQQPIETTRMVQIGKERRFEKRITQQHGDRRILELLLKVSEARRSLLGLNAPTSPNGNGSQPKIICDWDQLLYPTTPEAIAASKKLESSSGQ